jgi:hypothetical protein
VTAVGPRVPRWIKQNWAHVLFARGDRISPPSEFIFGDAFEAVGGDVVAMINLNRADNQWSVQFRRLPDGDVVSRAIRYDEGLDVLAEALRPHPGGLDVVLALIDRVIGPLAALRFAAAFQQEGA